MKKTKVFLFDLGNVLVEWSQNALVDDLIVSANIKDSIQVKKLFKEWNQEWDRGDLLGGTTKKMKEFPQYALLIDEYYKRWIETLGSPIEGTVAILKQLKDCGYRLYAASNWASDTFSLAMPRLYFLDLFDGIQISGQVGLIKPDIAFFQRMMTVYDFNAQDAIFIDDQETNVLAAQSIGISSIQFHNAEQLEQEINIFRTGP